MPFNIIMQAYIILINSIDRWTVVHTSYSQTTTNA
jgi:hypothetical protein